MKLSELLTEAAIPQEDLELVYNAVKKKELDTKEVTSMANDLVDDGYTGTVGGAKFVIDRIHVVVHGQGPHGYTQKQEETMMTPSGNIERFLSNKGIDVGDRIKRAKINMKGRVRKMNQKDATNIMAKYSIDVMKTLNKKQKQWLVSKRPEVLADIMAGESAEDAYNKVLATFKK